MEAVGLLIAILLRICAGAGYFIATLRGTAKPNIVSWFFWGITPLIACAVQLQQGVGVGALITLTLGLSPLAVFALAISKGDRKLVFSWTDKISGIFALLGILLWITTSDPLLALFFSIAGDIFSSIPTILKSYKDPDSERALPYFLSMLSMIVTLLSLHAWNIVHFAFPVYMLLINLLFFTLIQGRVGKRFKRIRSLFFASGRRVKAENG